jgi:nitric-oxide synthase
VVVSAEIDGLWVQRPYTITSPAGCTEWREITVKREDHGFLSNWLFSRPRQPRFKLSHPKGDLRVDPAIGEPVVCLVAGIGMTPALAIARSIDEVQGDRRLHIDYSARTQVDFAYRKELDELAARHDNITVQYRATGGRQRLDPGAVQAIHARWPGAQYLVCGPIGYMKMAEDLLLAVGVKPERVHLEVFKSVGHAPLNAAPEWGVAKLLQLGATLGLCVFYLLQAALG